MVSRHTPTRQRNNFSEGFALGLILNGRWSLAPNKIAIDLAVTGAFSVWPHADVFPQVAADMRGLDGIHALTRVNERKQRFAFYWDRSGRDIKIISRDPDWSEADPADVTYAVEMVGDHVPRDGWEFLGAEFLRRFER
jgi:hypothetical protein